MNRGYYYFMLMAHVLYEAYKHDVTFDVCPKECYPTTFRRTMIDFAVKLISKGGRIILGVTRALIDQIKMKTLWRRIATPKWLYQTQQDDRY